MKVYICGSSEWGRSVSERYLPVHGYFERSGGAERTSQPLSTSGDTSSLMEYPSTIIRLWSKRNDKLYAANKAVLPGTTQCSALGNGANETYLHAIEKPQSSKMGGKRHGSTYTELQL